MQQNGVGVHINNKTLNKNIPESHNLLLKNLTRALERASIFQNANILLLKQCLKCWSNLPHAILAFLLPETTKTEMQRLPELIHQHMENKLLYSSPAEEGRSREDKISSEGKRCL